MLRRALLPLLALALLAGLTPAAPAPAATPAKKAKKKCKKPQERPRKDRKRCGAAGRRQRRTFEASGKYVISWVKLDGTYTVFHDDGDNRFELSGKMSYRTGGPPRTVQGRDPDIRRPFDFDLLKNEPIQVGTLKSVQYTSTTTAHVVTPDRGFDCSYSLPEKAAPPGLAGVFMQRPKNKDKWDVQWSLLPAIARCPVEAPPWGFQPLPVKAMTDEFDRLLFEVDALHPAIPIDIDHKWNDTAGSHHITWKGEIGLTALDAIADPKCRSLCSPADLDGFGD